VQRYIHNTCRWPRTRWLLLRRGVSSRQLPAVVTDSPYDIATGQDRMQAAYLGAGYFFSPSRREHIDTREVDV
jgi:hypothetical protein